MPRTDLGGDDYKYYGVNYTDPHTCQAECEADSGCFAWTHVVVAHYLLSQPLPHCPMFHGDFLAFTILQACRQESLFFFRVSLAFAGVSV
jgi:hypothetical protein